MVRLNAKRLDLAFGDSAQLSATVTKQGQSVGDAKLTWASTDETIVKVNGTGKVRAVGPGNGKVVAKSRSGGSDTATVIVTPVITRVELSPQSYDFTARGQAAQFTATAFDDAGNSIEGVGLEWSTSNASIATVDSMGIVTSKGAGAATILVAALCCTASATASVTVSDDQQNLAPGSARFSDGFESGDKSHSENGFTWDNGPSVSTDHAHTGSYSLKFAYPATLLGKDASQEQRFTLAADAARAPKVVWLEYWVRVPENIEQYLTRAKEEHESGKPYNNKLFSLWSEYYDNRLGDAETTVEWKASGDFARIEVRPAVMAGTGSKVNGDKPEQSAFYTVREPIFRAVDAGKWVRVRIYAKARCKNEVNLRIWMDDRLVAEVRNFDTTWDGLDYFRRGYLFGWSNSGFDEPTTFYVDDFRMYASDPGW